MGKCDAQFYLVNKFIKEAGNNVSLGFWGLLIGPTLSWNLKKNYAV